MGALQNYTQSIWEPKWNIEELTTTTTFLDLQLSIINGKIPPHTKNQ